MDSTSAIQIVTPFTEGWETFVSSPYPDGTNADGSTAYAIGYGNHYYEDGSAVGAQDDPITPDRGAQLMTFFLQQSAAEVLGQVTIPLNDYQLAALTDFAYNAGSITPVLLSLINSGADAPTVAAQIQVSATTAGGIPNSGLANRRAAEAGLYQQTGGGGASAIALGIALVAVILLLQKK